MRSVTIKGDKPLTVISVEEYENMKETLELLTLYPDMLKELQEERKKIEKGEFITLSDYRAKYENLRVWIQWILPFWLPNEKISAYFITLVAKQDVLVQLN